MVIQERLFQYGRYREYGIQGRIRDAFKSLKMCSRDELQCREGEPRVADFEFADILGHGLKQHFKQ